MDTSATTPQIATDQNTEQVVPQQPAVEQKAETVQWEFGPCPLKDICNCAWQGKHADVFWHSAFSHKKFIKVWDPYEWIKLRDFEDSCDKEYIKRVLIRNDDTDKVFVFTVVAAGQITRLQGNFFGDPTREEEYFFEVSIMNHSDTFVPKFKGLCIWKPDRNISIDDEYALPVFSSVLKKYCIDKDLLVDVHIKKNSVM